MTTTLRLTDVALRLHREDTVAVAVRDIPAGSVLCDDPSRDLAGDPPGDARDGREIVVGGDVPRGHKVALRAVEPGAPVRKYGQIIGFASAPIAPGEHVHTHNLAMGDFERDYAFGADVRELAMVPEAERASFQGIVRADGRVATRNYIGILTSVNCSATAARLIADQFKGMMALADFPNVDGVVALTHGTGCGMAGYGEGFELLRRTLTGYAHHPNFAGFLVIGLGCEVNQVSSMVEGFDLPEGAPVHAMTMQELGGTAATVREGVARIRDMLPAANDVRRVPVPASRLVLGLNCGGSDGYSGITANPALGAASDLLVRHGGTSILGETPEVYGAEHLLTRRAVSREVGERLVERIRWWERYTAVNGGNMDNNPAPGNKAGGLTTILEKSLGAVAKGGQSNLSAVYEYAEPVTAKGFTFMDTPGYDPVSVTGMVAGGANVVCFTTGRGSCFGCKPVPSIKLCTNTETYLRMSEDMDVNCGVILDDGVSVEELGQRIFELVLEVASGRKTKSEELGVGDEEFAPWQVGAVM